MKSNAKRNTILLSTRLSHLPSILEAVLNLPPVMFGCRQSVSTLISWTSRCFAPPFPNCCGSSLREGDINRIRGAYNISESVNLRIPLEDEGPDCNRPDEVVVYEAFFALGLHDLVPSLVEKMANFIGILPGQLNPHVWRVLIAIQVFEETPRFKSFGIRPGQAVIECDKFPEGVDGVARVFDFTKEQREVTRCQFLMP